MKLQLALDDLTFDDALELTEKVQDYIDIIEIGTPFIYQEGMRAVKMFKQHFFAKEILADMKIMDAGYYEAEEALKAGADYVTVLGITDNLTIKGCIEAAEKYDKEIVVDMICVPDMPKRIRELENLGAHGLAVHVGTDQQAAGRKPIDDLRVMAEYCKTARISVAGGISADTTPKYAALKPEVLIVGSGITHAKNPLKAAKEIKKSMEEC
ncbi:3-hexulose-6-phosphate synthase [Clostridium sp. C105KSO13]|uniref:3-hexulose-6-phosphate synthase n=1 Tax=Clostridium sp. C105KSO13 TaxID=1776045 RepID=UPI0007405E84|nr:3-hexulose-6-phosphate synthase [Clostridium sp. C105KSO13]CUX26116.1 3-hexulose-6-phosphate synthase [Clostridium sp. C105KSO13]